MKNRAGYFTKSEVALWGASVLLVLISFMVFDRKNYLTSFSPEIGTTRRNKKCLSCRHTG